MPAKHLCNYYGQSCEVGSVEMHCKKSGHISNFPFVENRIDILFTTKKSIKRLSMYSWGKWVFVTDDLILRIDIKRYCPNCGHSVLMKMERVMELFRKCTAYCDDDVEFQGVDGSIANSLP